MRDVVIIGGGHNGLIAAAFLAKAGLKPLVLERADRVGGCAITAEIAPGFRCPTLAHRAAIDPVVMQALGLERHGLKILRPEALVVRAGGRRPRADAVGRHGARSGARSRRSRRGTRNAIRHFWPASRRSAASCGGCWPRRRRRSTTQRAGSHQALESRPEFRALGRTDAYRLLRWLPMAVADLAQRMVRERTARAVVAAGGVFGSFVGPRSAGSAAVLLRSRRGDGHPIAPGWAARGGIGALSDAIAAAAREAGRGDPNRRRGSADHRRRGVATGVVLASGERDRRAARRLERRPPAHVARTGRSGSPFAGVRRRVFRTSACAARSPR